MTREDIIKLAREACDADKVDAWHNGFWTLTQEELERFAALVAAHVRETEFKPDWNNYQQGLADGAAAEREACAKVCERYWSSSLGSDGTATAIAAAIRARGETK